MIKCLPSCKIATLLRIPTQVQPRPGCQFWLQVDFPTSLPLKLTMTLKLTLTLTLTLTLKLILTLTLVVKVQ